MTQHPPPAAPTQEASSDYKTTLLPLLLSTSVLSFGSYTLKSGRLSPYFFTSSLLHTAPLLRATAASYAAVLSAPPFTTPPTTHGPHSTSIPVSNQGGNPGGGAGPSDLKPTFDVLFGPAYKGIPLCAAIVTELAVNHAPHFDAISYAFNRKEAKPRGEGGVIVGCPLKGKRVVIVDDVITAGTALREAVSIIEREGGVVAGVVVLLDREERVSEEVELSAVGVARRDLGVPVKAVVGLGDLIERLRPEVGEGQVRRLEEYKARYGAREE